MTLTLEEQRKSFASRLSLLKHEAGTLGLYLTMQRMDPALRMVGFEIAGTPDKCYKYEQDLKEAEQGAQKSGEPHV